MLDKILEILRRKDLFIAAQQQELEDLIVQLGAQFARDLARIIARGAVNTSEIAAAIEAAGYDRAIAEKLDKAEDLFAFSREVLDVFGIRAVLTPQNEADLIGFLVEIGSAVQTEIKAHIQKDMTRFAITAKISERPTKQIIAEIEEKFEAVGRRAGTEVGTALAQFDRATSKAMYEAAGIERFQYFGPNDEVTRDSCSAVLSNPKNETGFTLEEIKAMPGVDFVLGGKPYYNCRHEFLPAGIG